jgi:hypothetical protein
MYSPIFSSSIFLTLRLFIALVCGFVCLPVHAQLAELVWAETESGLNVIAYSKWNGEEWSDPIQIYENSNAVSTPSLATQIDGTKVLVWSEQQRRKSVLMWKKRSPIDETWSEASVFSRFGIENVSPSLVNDLTGTLWVFWSAQQDGLSDVFVSKQHAGSWSQPQQVNGLNKVPDIKPIARILEDGSVHVEWRSYDFDVGDYVSAQKSFTVGSTTIQGQANAEHIDVDPDKISLPAFISGQSYATMHLPNNRLIQSYRIEPNYGAQ